MLTIPGFPVFLCLVVTSALKKHLSSICQEIRPQSAFTDLGPSCPLQTILLSDQVVCDSSLQFADSNSHLVHFFPNLKCTKQLYYLQQAVKSAPASSNFYKSAPNCFYYLQWAVTPDWMCSIAL